MKLKSIPILVIATTALSGVALLLAGPTTTSETSTTPSQTGQGMMGAPAMGGTMMNNGQATMPGAMPQGGMMNGMGMMGGRGMMGNMMRMYGVTPGMLNQGRMMMHATLTRDDPTTILGLKTQLNLNDSQVAKLEAITASAQRQARAVLTDSQRTQLDQLPTMNGSMAQMYARMMAHRQQMHQQAGAAWRGPMSMMMGMPMMNTTPTETQKQ